MHVQPDVRDLPSHEQREVPKALPFRSPIMVRVLVGERIRAQSDHPLLISLSELNARIDAIEDGARPHPLRVVIGQGAPAAAIVALHRRIATDGIADLIMMEQPLLPAAAELTHKHKLANCLITEPTQLDVGAYLATLLIDEHCADMDDHLTGVHLQGMLIIEAARQMLLAVTEKYHLLAQDRGLCRFSTESLAITYLEFLFPLPATIHFGLQVVRRLSERNFLAAATARFEQAGRRIAEAKIRFSVIERAYVARREEAAFNDRLTMISDAAQVVAAAPIQPAY